VDVEIGGGPGAWPEKRAVPVAVSDVIAWIAGMGWDGTQETGAPLVMGPYVPGEPDTVVVLTATPGAGYQFDGATDVCGLQARVRGGQSGDGSTGPQAATEALAYKLDALIYNASYPARLASGKTLVTAHRLSGMPSPMPQAGDDQDRWT
jgi:hypothetical protein